MQTQQLPHVARLAVTVWETAYALTQASLPEDRVQTKTGTLESAHHIAGPVSALSQWRARKVILTCLQQAQHPAYLSHLATPIRTPLSVA